MAASIFCAAPVDAHVLTTSGLMGGVLHVDPNDDPIAGQVSKFYLTFKDREGKFSPQKCECTVVISESGKDLYTTTLSTQGSDQTFAYTFPKTGVYTITMTGKPAAAGVFNPFTLTYTMRVARESSEGTQPENPWYSIHAIHLIVVLIGSVFAVVMIHKEGKRNK